jgi:hypothetical protein
MFTKTNAQTKATKRDVEAMKNVLKTQGAEASFMLGQLYSACGVTFTEDQTKEIKACEEENSGN